MRSFWFFAVAFVLGVSAALLASASSVVAQQGSGAGEVGPYADTPADVYYAEAVAFLAQQGVLAGTL